MPSLGFFLIQAAGLVSMIACIVHILVAGEFRVGYLFWLYGTVVVMIVLQKLSR